LRVLVIGSGAREHTLVWRLSQSKRINSLYAAPGNAGIGQIAQNLDIKTTDFEGLAKAVKANRIDLIVVGPENPLADGVVDYFHKAGVPIFGPTQAAAQIEASKAFSKELFQKYGIPCAQGRTFADIAKAKEYVRLQGAPLVIKADGLAAGKGVIMAETVQQALEAVSSIMENKAFGVAGNQVIIEEKLSGREMSFFAITDGKTVVPTVPACDYKRADDGDRGLNTGGMGSYSPPFFYNEALGQKIMRTVIEPTIQAMQKENRPYQGVLYAGLMVNGDDPKLLEYNARFGDPECQVILPRLKSDLLDIILGVVNQDLKSVTPVWDERVCVGVVLASGGYPGTYQTGVPISGLEDAGKDIMIFHAGTKKGNYPNQVLTNGGRVLTVAALGQNIAEARAKIYAAITGINFNGMHYRRDIAKI
jgi:phosphoribosylamine---glycine ligase